MNQIQIHLVNVGKNKPLPNSEVNRTCYAEKHKNSWTLYVQHEFGGIKHLGIFAKTVNEVMDGCLKDTAELTDMLSCDLPSQIAGILNAHDVKIDHHEESELLGKPVPKVLHYLMNQYPLCNFEEGMRVAYGRDEGKKITQKFVFIKWPSLSYSQGICVTE